MIFPAQIQKGATSTQNKNLLINLVLFCNYEM